MAASEQTVVQIIEDEVAAGIPLDRIVVGGFSQGGAVSLSAGLQYPGRLAGVLCISGWFANRDAFRLAPEAAATPVGHFHGDADPTVVRLSRRSILRRRPSGLSPCLLPAAARPCPVALPHGRTRSMPLAAAARRVGSPERGGAAGQGGGVVRAARVPRDRPRRRHGRDCRHRTVDRRPAPAEDGLTWGSCREALGLSSVCAGRTDTEGTAHSCGDSRRGTKWRGHRRFTRRGARRRGATAGCAVPGVSSSSAQRAPCRFTYAAGARVARAAPGRRRRRRRGGALEHYRAVVLSHLSPQPLNPDSRCGPKLRLQKIRTTRRAALPLSLRLSFSRSLERSHSGCEARVWPITTDVGLSPGHLAGRKARRTKLWQD